MIRRWATWVLAAAVMLAAPSAHAARDTLTIGLTQFPSTFHPSIDSMMAKSYILAMTRRPFTTFDADWKLVCMLCTRLPTLENGEAVLEATPDGKKGIAVTFTIRPDAAWGDGVPVTTKDVLFTWKVGRHPLSGVSNIELYRDIRDVTVIDDKAFTLHLGKAGYQYNAINDFDLLPAHLDEAAFTEPAEYKHRTAFDTDTTNPGLYNGPYRIAEVVPGSHVVLAPNPAWKGPGPHFERIAVRAIENTAALEANLLAGTVDMIAGELGLSLDQALSLEKRHGDRFSFLYQPGLTYEHVELNLDNPILADRRVRRALLHAVDRTAISTQLFAGKQPVADGNISPRDPMHADDLPRYAFDPGTAARLLDEAGWRRSGNGVRRNASGAPLRLEIMTTAGNRIRELVEQVLQSQWRAVGIDVRIRNQPPRVLFGQTLTERRFSAMAMFAWISSPENVPRTTLHSSNIPTPANNFAGQNYTGFANEEADDLIDRLEIEMDADARRALWHRLQQVYAEELPALPLYFRANAFVLPKWLKGVRPTGHQYPTALWVENWRAE